MNYFDAINVERNVFLTKLQEPEQNILQFELTIGRVGELEKDEVIQGVGPGPVRPIFYDEQSETYRVTFNSYVAYSVLNERFENLGDNGYVGEKIRIYEHSNFLEYLKADTFATKEYPGDFKHYAFVSLKHIVNVAATQEPIIEQVSSGN